MDTLKMNFFMDEERIFDYNDSNYKFLKNGTFQISKNSEYLDKGEYKAIGNKLELSYNDGKKERFTFFCGYISEEIYESNKYIS